MRPGGAAGAEQAGSVRLEDRGGGRVDLVIERAHRANALTSALARELEHHLRQLAAFVQRGAPEGDEVACAALPRVVVLRGAGRHFCGGADLHEMSRLDVAGGARFIRGLHEILRAIRTLPLPVVACVRGAALGAGLEMLASCDLAVAADDAVLGMPEPHVGMPSVNEAALLPGIVGLTRAREMLLLGDSFPASRALELGLVNRVAPVDGLDAAVDEIVAALLRHDGETLALQKALIHRWSNLPMDEAIEAGVGAFAQALAGEAPGRAMRSALGRRGSRGRSSPDGSNG